MTRKELLDWHIEQRENVRDWLRPREMHFGCISAHQEEQRLIKLNRLLDFHERVITRLADGTPL